MGRKIRKEEHSSNGYIDLTSSFNRSSFGGVGKKLFTYTKKEDRGGGSFVSKMNESKLLGYIMLGIIFSGLLTFVILLSTGHSFNYLGSPVTGSAIVGSEKTEASIESTTESLQETIESLKEVVQALTQLLTIKDSSGQLISANIGGGNGGVVVTPSSGPVSKITFYNLKVTDNVALGIDTVPTSIGFEKIYAIDPSDLEFDNATVTVEASGDKLFKCADWNFTNQVCLGRWRKVKDIVPGQEYDFLLTADDPGFGENNDTVVTLDSGDYLISTNQTILQNNSGVYDIVVVPLEYINDTIEEIIIYDFNESSGQNELKIEDNFTVGSYNRSYAIEPTNLSFNNATVRARAIGRDLFKCTDWNFTNQSCYGRWKKIGDFIPGQEYNFTLTAEDPGFGEGNKRLNLLDKDLYLMDYTETVLVEDVTDIEITPSNGKIKKINIRRHNISSLDNDIILDEDLNVTISNVSLLQNEFSINSLNLSFDNATIILNATGKDFFECINWSRNNKICLDENWTKVRDLTQNETYNITLQKGVRGYGESKKDVILLNKDLRLLNFNERSLNSSQGHKDLHIELMGLRVHSIKVMRHNVSSPRNELKMESTVGQLLKPFGFWEEAYSMDPTSLEFDYAEVNITASGNTLFKCESWNFSTQECTGRWQKLMDLVPGEQYVFNLSSADPGFGELNNTVNILDKDNYLVENNVTTLNTVGEMSDVELILENNTVERVTIYGLNTSNDNEDFKIEQNVSASGFVKTYSIDPTGLDFDNATVTVTANSTKLYKCADWNFTTQSCYGSWVLFKTGLVPGQEYTFTLTADDPGFGEGNSTFINLVAPANNYNEMDNQNVTFHYNITGGSANITNCTIYVKGIGDGTYDYNVTDTSITKEVNQTFNVNFEANGLHEWNITCFDSIGEQGYSEVRNITMNVAGLSAPLATIMQQFWWLNSSDGTIGLENQSYDSATIGDLFHLRAGVGATGLAWKNQEVEIFYSLTGVFGGEEIQVTATSENVSFWDDLDHTDQTLITASGSVVLTGTTIVEHYVESFPSATLVQVDPLNQGEWDFALNFSQPGTYYLQVRDTIAELNNYLVFPNITVQPRNDPPVVNLITPANASIDGVGNITFRCNITEDTALANLTLYVWNSTSEYNVSTTAVTGLFNESEWNLTNIPNGNYTWNCLGVDSVSQGNWEDSNWSFVVDVDITPPSNLFSYQDPADVDTFSVFDKSLNITYNATDSSGVDTVLLHYKTNSSTNNCWVIANGTNQTCDYQTKTSNLNTSVEWLFRLFDNDIYPAIYNWPNERELELTPHESYDLSGNNQLIKTRFYNISASKNYTVLEVMANNSNVAGTTSMRVYYCNDTYVSGKVDTNDNCINFYNVPAQTAYNHSHSDYSKHLLIPVAIDIATGNLGTVKVTPTSYFILRGDQGVNSWTVGYISNVTRTDTIQTSTNTGSSWSNFVGTVDAHLHQYDGSDKISYYSCANDTAGNENCTAVREDLIDLAGLPPTAPDVYNPVEGTYPGFVTINYTAAQSPNGYSITNYNITLVNKSEGYVQSINETNYLNLSYYWNSSEAPDGEYYIKVEACDSEGQCSNGLSANFTVDNSPPTIQFVDPTTETGNYSADSISANVTAVNGASGIDTIIIYLYNSTALVNSSTSSTSSFYLNFTSLTDDTYYFNATANDTAGNVNNTETRMVVIDSSVPLIQFVDPTPVNGANLSRLDIAVNATASDNALDTIVLRLYNETNLINTTTSSTSPLYINFTELSNGDYYFNATVNDTVGNVNITETRIVTLDTVEPLVVIESPLNQTYLNATVLVNLTTSDTGSGVDSKWFFNGTANVTYTSEVEVVYEDRQNTLFAYANDSAGNVNETLVLFVVDTIEPYVAFVSPLNQTYNDAEVLINISSDGDYTWWFNGTANLTYTSELSLNFSDGQYPLYAYSNDSAGNVNETSVTFVVDAVAPVLTVYSPENRTYANATITINFTADSYTDLWYFNETANVSYTSEVYETVSEDQHTYIFYANDSAGNLNETSVTFVVDTITPQISNFKFYALNSSMDYLGNETAFNTSNLEEIEFMNITFTLNDSSGMAGDIAVYFTANGSNGCSLGNKQSSSCYNFSGNNWIEFRNGTETSTFKDLGAQGDYFTCSYTGTFTERNYTCQIDEHYNPNVFKHYDADYNFSDIKWQNGVGERILGDNIAKINLSNSLIPLDADQYKLDFRVDVTGTPNKPLNAYLCNSSYVSGDPSTLAECSLITQKSPSELQDDGTKFRGIFTKQLLDELGDIEYAILQTDQIDAGSYYSLKTYKALAPAYVPNLKVSNDAGGSWAGIGDGYESELNINWFYNDLDPTQILFKIESNDTSGNLANSSIYSMTWNIETSQNYPPLVDLIIPVEGANISANIDINWTTADPNDDNYTTNITAYNGTDTLVIASDLAGVVSIYNWDTTNFEDGEYNLTVISCENETAELYCANDTHKIFVDNTEPYVAFVSPTNTTYNDAEVLINISSEGSYTWWFNGTENLTYSSELSLNFSDGSHTLYAYTNDTLGNVNETSVTFALDTLLPVITINSPLNQTYGNATVLVNITSDGDYVWFYNGSANVTYTEEVDVLFSEESNTLTVWANDSAGNTNETFVVFAVDTTGPIVNLVSPANGTVTSTSSQTFSCNITNLEIANLTLYVWNSTFDNVYTNTTPLSGTINETSWVFSLPSEGRFDWSCFGKDVSGNSNWGSQGNYSISLDNLDPAVQFVDPTFDEGSYAIDSILANVTSSDDNLGSIDIYLYNSTALINLSSSSTSPFYLNFSGLPDDTYNLQALANDSAGNSNSTETRTIKLDHVEPLVTIISPINTTYNVTNNVWVNISASDDLAGVDSIWFFNGTANITYANEVFIEFKNGSNIFYAYANDSAGNVNETQVLFVVNVTDVDSDPPAVISLTPTPESVYNVSREVLISANVTDDALVSSVLIQVEYPNGTSLNLTAGNDGDIYSYNLTDTVQKGVYNITFIATDNSGNVNDTEITGFERVTAVENQTFDIVDPNSTNINYTSTVLNNVSGLLDIEVNFTNQVFASMVIYGFNESSPYNVIRLANETSDNTRLNNTFAIDLSDADVESVNITLIASGNTLYKCTNYTFSTTTCNDGYTFLQYVTPGESYVITLNRTDPGFGETSPTNGTPDGGAYDPFGDGFTSEVNTYTATQVDDSVYHAVRSKNVGAATADLGAWLNLTYNITDTVSGISVGQMQNLSFLSNYCFNDNDVGGFVCGGGAIGGTANNPQKLQILNVTSGAFQTIGEYNASGADPNEFTRVIEVLGGASDFVDSDNLIKIRYEANVTITVGGNDASFGVDLAQLTITSDIVGPAISIVTPQNITYNNATQLVNISASDASLGLDSIWFYNGSANVTYTSEVDVLFNEDQNTLTAWANDTGGNVNSTSVVFVIDSTAPTVTIHSPLNQSYNNATVLVNLSAVNGGAGIDSIWFFNGSANVTYTSEVEVVYSDTQHTLTAWANDTVSNVGSLDVVFAVDTSFPSVINVTPTAGREYNLSDSVNITANVTDTVALDTVLANVVWDGGSQTVVMTDTDGDDVFNVTFTNTVAVGRYNVTILANDTAGNLNDTVTTWFNVTGVDAPPIVVLIAPEDNTITNVIDITFRCNASDDQKVDNLTLYLWNTTSEYNVSTTAVTGLFNESEWDLASVADMNYTWNCLATDNSSQSSWGSANYSLIVDTINPGVVINSPTNITYGNSTVSVDLTTSDSGSGVDTVWFFNGTGNQTYTSAIEINFSEGGNTLYAYSNDTAGNVNETSVVFVVDTALPQVTINSPLNQSYNNGSILVDIDAINVAEAGIDSIWFFNGSANVTYTVPVYVEYAEGQHTLDAWANDTAGNVGTDSVVFVVDTSAPNITGIATTPTLPISNNGSAQVLSINFSSDEFPVNVTFNLYDSAGAVVNVTGPLQIDSVANLPLNFTIPTGLSDGDYSLNMTVADGLGQENNYSVGSLTVDTTPPLITSTTVQPYALVINDTLFLNATAANGNVTLWAVITLPDLSTTTIVLPDGYYNVTQAGRHDIVFYANDSAGNEDSGTDYFMSSGVNQTVVFNIVDYNVSGVAVNLTVYLPGSVKFIDDYTFTGTQVDAQPGLLYDLWLRALNGTQILFRDVNATLDNNRTLGLDLLETPVTDYLYTLGVNNTYTFSNATLTLNYTDSAFSNEGYLGLYKCSDWNFTGRACLGSWTDITSSATKDTDANTFVLTVTNFSAFSIKQEAVPTTPSEEEAPSAGGGGGGVYCVENWVCSEWVPCTNGITERTCFDANECGTEQNKPDVEISCDEVLVYCNDGVLNQDETDVDCGGEVCKACAEGGICLVNADCEVGDCIDGVCGKEVPAPAEEDLVPKDMLFVMFLVILGSVLLYLAAYKLVVLHKERPIGERLGKKVIGQRVVLVEKAEHAKESFFLRENLVMKSISEFFKGSLGVIVKILKVIGFAPIILVKSVYSKFLSLIGAFRRKARHKVQRVVLKERVAEEKLTEAYEETVKAERATLGIIKSIVTSPVILIKFLLRKLLSKLTRKERPLIGVAAPIEVPKPEKRLVIVKVKPFIPKIDVEESLRVVIPERKGPSMFSRWKEKISRTRERSKAIKLVRAGLSKRPLIEGELGSYLYRRRNSGVLDIVKPSERRRTSRFNAIDASIIKDQVSKIAEWRVVRPSKPKSRGIIPSEIKGKRPEPVPVMEMIHKIEKSIGKKIPPKSNVAKEIKEMYENKVGWSEKPQEKVKSIKKVDKKEDKINASKLLSSITSKWKDKESRPKKEKISAKKTISGVTSDVKKEKKTTKKKRKMKGQKDAVKEWMKDGLREVYG